LLRSIAEGCVIKHYFAHTNLVWMPQVQGRE